jgi:hypothetical protein
MAMAEDMAMDFTVSEVLNHKVTTSIAYNQTGNEWMEESQQKMAEEVLNQ